MRQAHQNSSPGLDAEAHTVGHGPRVGLASKPVPTDLYFGLIICPDAVVEKINQKHGITEQDVRDTVQWPARPAKAYWIGQTDDPRGPRAVVIGWTPDGRRIKVVLYPADGPFEGTWRLGTAVVET